MVNGVITGQDDLGDGDEGISLLKQGLDDGGQGLRSVERGVVEQDDGARLDLGGHPPGNLPGG